MIQHFRPNRPEASSFSRCLLSAAMVSLIACSGGSPVGSSETLPPKQGDVVVPSAIDAVGGPATYKGLPLRLVARAAPTITPVEGVIGVVCIGMSNATQECSEWIRQITSAWKSEVSSNVRVVDCAVGGHAIEKWIDPTFDATLWNDCINRKIPQAGLRLNQVRVIWHKAADQFGVEDDHTSLPFYPSPDSDYQNFFNNLTTFSARVKPMFPAVQAVYTSSRSYGGFTSNPARGEPLSYEEGHALNTWLSAHTSVDGVWYGWGPYLWAPACESGETNGTGVCYIRSDYQGDGVHPSETGRVKIAREIHSFFRTQSWYGS